MTMPDLSVEAFSVRDMNSLLNEAAREYEAAAARLRGLREAVDAVSNGTNARRRYTHVALDAQKIIESATFNASLWRIAKVAVEADVDRAARTAHVSTEDQA